MPRSKRAKTVALTKTAKKEKGGKAEFIKKVQSCIDSYRHVYTYSVENMRNSKLKEAREQWKASSRFFYGKNKLMQLAFGRTPSEEYKPGTHRLGSYLRGSVGLFFTNESRTTVLQWFQSHSEPEYARSGNTASESVCLSAGPVPQFSHTMEPHLRSLGLPTRLIRGVVTLTSDYTICEQGSVLTPEQAKLLVHFEKPLVQFHVILLTVMDLETGVLEELAPSPQLPPKAKSAAAPARQVKRRPDDRAAATTTLMDDEEDDAGEEGEAGDGADLFDER